MCLIRCDPDVTRSHHWLNTKDLESSLFHTGLNVMYILSIPCKSSQIHVHIYSIVKSIYSNRYCLNVLLYTNDSRYLFQILYLYHILYTHVCMEKYYSDSIEGECEWREITVRDVLPDHVIIWLWLVGWFWINVIWCGWWLCHVCFGRRYEAVVTLVKVERTPSPCLKIKVYVHDRV